MKDSNQQIKIFIAGATGFCGQTFVTALAKNPKYQPIAHIRPQSSRLQTVKKNFEDLGVPILCCEFKEM